MCLEPSESTDFTMVYFNADGRQSSMCGNGGRCIVALAQRLGIIEDKTFFTAIDGQHEARIDSEAVVSLKMIDVESLVDESSETGGDAFILDTGSPHFVLFNDDIDNIDMVNIGKEIRYSERFKAEGINVNCVEKTTNGLKIRTYERGVEDETLACGTGVTAAALSAAANAEDGSYRFHVEARGGQLEVAFTKIGHQYKEVWLQGPATFVFEGLITL